MEQRAKPSPEQVSSSDPCSFSSSVLGRILQLSLVKYPLKLLQKASLGIGLVFPAGTISRFDPSRSLPGLLAGKRRGNLERLLLSVIPTRVQNLLGSLPAAWGRSNMPKDIPEAPSDPSSKASKRKRDDVALEEQESWFVVLGRDLPEEDSEDLTYEPSEAESDSEEYLSHNDTDLELEEQAGIAVPEPSDIQGSVPPPEPGAAGPAVPSSGEDAPDVARGGAWEPGATGSIGNGTEQEEDTAGDSSS